VTIGAAWQPSMKLIAIMMLTTEQSLEVVCDTKPHTCGVCRCEQAGVVGLVLGEQERHLALTVQEVVLEEFLKQRIRVVGVNDGVALGGNLLQNRLRAVPRPRPGVAEPQCGKHTPDPDYRQ
jgi:hypothetical protein